ncbi:MAG: hypothetical protein DIZ80_02150 [endosymbiont of Galathealinum brachiosum]|uniref:Response regulatory domain-containing protein n=1 Tax=endosymbiont of Galathealinum brachiosum TaxID=2200906 RepID=A0A370DK32_9GAMM|nr:MAG: hypothetical protein DIZ80_02150 [endosymbiont of Galathealinum brachiosum]
MNKLQTNLFSILIVDDNPDNIYLIRFLLERAGFKILEATNAKQAISIVKKNNISLILMDIQMPGMDGIEATRIIKNLATPVIIVALTARIMEEDKNEIETAGCDGIIEKPIDPCLFQQQIESYLDKN